MQPLELLAQIVGGRDAAKERIDCWFGWLDTIAIPGPHRYFINGSGDVVVTGRVDLQEIIITGSGKHDAAGLESDATEVSISGSSKVTVWLNDTLDARISSSGQVSYYGTPTVNSTASGSGSTNSLGSR